MGKEYPNGNSQLISTMTPGEGKNSIEGYLPKITPCVRTFCEAAYRGGKNSDS